ncbi:MAG: signal peptidase II [Gammaproteobacteria bacterium]|jgi:signal peptidase II
MSRIFNSDSMLKWLWITALVVLIDQVSKQWVSHSLQMFEVIRVMPMLNIYLAHNPGAAFSFLSAAGGWQRWLFTLIALIVSIGLILWLRKLKPHERGLAIGLAFILGGALGNVLDRVVFGYVIDFIQFYYPGQRCLPGFSPLVSAHGAQCIWPTFNIADSAITIGVAVLLLDGVFGMRRQRQGGAEKRRTHHG